MKVVVSALELLIAMLLGVAVFAAVGPSDAQSFWLPVTVEETVSKPTDVNTQR